MQNLKWIDINLPYSYSGGYSGYPPYPDISQKEKEKFGFTYDNAEKTANIYFNKNLKHSDTWIKFLEEFELWEKGLPELEEYRNQIRKWDKKQEVKRKKSFCGQGLNKAGIIIELEDGTIHLIGTINELRGVCDDCTAFESNVKVKRYAVLVDFEKEFSPNKELING